jgi:phosphopantetheinyl transferase (holo-ACP synthase)
MPPRPFRQSLSIGTDICHHPRFSKYFPIHQHLASTTTAISSQSLLFKLFDKAFVPAEQRAFWRRFQPSSASKGSPNSVVDGTEQQIFWTEKKAEEAAKFLGGRWAAKEATIKAFTAQRRLVLRDVRVWSVGQGKQPLALVVDEVEGGVKKYDSAKEVYERFLLQRRLGEELKLLQRQGKQGNEGTVLPSSGGLRIIKRPILSRHTARSMEMKKMAPLEPETETSTKSPPILSKTGILNLNAVTDILNQGEETSTSIPATQTPQAGPQSQQQQLEEEIERLNREELEEDGWDNMQGQIVKVSISHDGEYCVATALAAV